MRGTGNPIKKPEKINKILDNSKLLILNLASNNNTDSNNINNLNTHNIRDRKKTSSQDQNKKSKVQKSAKKSFNDISQDNAENNSNYNDKSFEKNLTDDNNKNFELNVYGSKDSLTRNLDKNGYIETNNSISDKKDFENISSENNNKDVKNTINDLNEHLFNNSKKNFKKNDLYLENIFDYQASKSPEKSELNAEKTNKKIDHRESYRGLKNKFKLEDNNNLNTSREMEEKVYPGKLTDNNVNLRIIDNPFTVNPNYKPENTSETDDPKQKEVKISFNLSTKPEQKVILTPSKPNNKSTSNSKNASSKTQLKIGTQKVKNNIHNMFQPSIGNVKGKDSKSPNERDNQFNNILLISNSNLSPNVNNHNNNNNNGVNINNFNKNNKKGNPTQTNNFKHNSNVNQNKSNAINLNNHLNAFKNQPTINTDNKEENFILQTNSNSISPNNFLSSLSNQNKNNGNYSTTNSATSNVLISSNFQNHVCHTVENENHNRDETITVNYCNTNPNENHKINLLKFNKNANFNFTKIKENEGEKFSLKNNSLNKILQNMKGNNQPYSINNQSTINNLNGITNSNILSTNHTDNNTLLNSNNFPNNGISKANKDLTTNNKKSLVMSVDMNTEKPLKKSIDLSNKNNNKNINTNNILKSSVKDSQDLAKNLHNFNKNEKSNNADTPRKNKNNNYLNLNNVENKLINNKIINSDNDENNRINNLDKSNKEVITYIDSEEKKESTEKIIFNSRENPNRLSSNIEKSKLKKNSLSNNTNSYINNIQNNKILGTKENRISKDLDKNNNIISSYNNKQNPFKDKNLNLKNLDNLNNDNILKNFNYVSIGYLDNPLANSGTLISKDKNKSKNIDAKSIKKNEKEGKIETSNQKNDLLNSNSIKDIQNKLNPNNKYDLNTNKVNIINIKDMKESTNAYGKNNSNIQNIAVAKSLNLISKKNQVISSITKVKKDNIDKISCVNISNKILTSNKNSITSKNSGVIGPESKNGNVFIKKDMCRIFNSDDFYERNKAKQPHLQEVTNTLNNMKLNSLYSKNLSQKINQSKNIQINLYNHYENELDPDKLYNLDFNSNLKNKEKTIIIDDIEELENESYKYSEKKPNIQQTKQDEIPLDGFHKNSKNNLIPNSNNQAINKISDDTFKSDILHSILNFKGFFKNNEKNLLENIYQSQDCVVQLNQLNQKLGKLKNPTKSNLELEKDKIYNYKIKEEEDCIVKIKDSPLKPEISYFKQTALDRQKVHISENKRINELQNPKRVEADRDYYYFQKEDSFINDKISNVDNKNDYNDINKQTDITKKLNYFLAEKDRKISEEPVKKSREDNKTAESYLEKAQKTNIMNEIHFNSDVRMKRYEILLEFINTNMKEIGKMVSGDSENELKKSNELNHVKRSNENDKNDILNNKFINQNNFDPRHKINFSKNEDFSDPKNIYYTSYVNSLKKIEETNSNKVSSLHSKINLNSRLSNNEFNIDNSEMKESNNIGEDAIKHPNLFESNFTNHFKEQINNLSLLLNLQNKENNNNKNLNIIDDKNLNNVTNEFESINFYKNKKDPASSLLISSIYSDFNQDLIDESFNNNILHLISNPNQHSKVFPNGFFTTSNTSIGIPNSNELYIKKESLKLNKDINEFNKIGEGNKLDSKTNLANLNTNNLTQNQIINNIITINNNYNRSKQQLAVVNDSKSNVNQAYDKSTIPLTKSKNELNNANLKHNFINDVKSKNNLDKNLLTLITNNNLNKMLNKNIQNPNIPINKINNFPLSDITKINTLSDPNNIEVKENKIEIMNQERKNSKQSEKDMKAFDLENKDSSEIMIEKETNINLIKNIDNNFNNINAINIKTAKSNQINEDQKGVLRAIHSNINHNFIKLDNKINSDPNPNERSTLRMNPQIMRPLMSPSNDSDRTIVQFNEKNVNLENFEMNYLLGDSNNFKPELKAPNTENMGSNVENPNNFMDEVGKNQYGRLDNKLKVQKEPKTNLQKNEKIMDEEINKDKPKCLIF